VIRAENTIRSNAGPTLFARYAYPPNALGYCGPDDSTALLHAVGRFDNGEGLRSIVARFDGALPYLTLIAACNGLDDPLDRRVVEAYWVGNNLLRQVSPGALAQWQGNGAAAALAGRGVAHHSFHVFAVYPWLALLRSGREQPALQVLDQCRIRWGYVQSLAGDVVTVQSQALVFDGSRLLLEPGRFERARRRCHGYRLAPAIRPGDVVALHWDWVCDRLTPRRLSWLKACTTRNLDAVNAASRA
jgi:hypothetical protein